MNHHSIPRIGSQTVNPINTNPDHSNPNNKSARGFDPGTAFRKHLEFISRLQFSPLAGISLLAAGVNVAATPFQLSGNALDDWGPLSGKSKRRMARIVMDQRSLFPMLMPSRLFPCSTVPVMLAYLVGPMGFRDESLAEFLLRKMPFPASWVTHNAGIARRPETGEWRFVINHDRYLFRVSNEMVARELARLAGLGDFFDANALVYLSLRDFWLDIGEDGRLLVMKGSPHA